ncbi:MAG: hypothetical protein JO250_09940 [Armatimonadetes bacterium]|nr:hypothetical protein [Armatimonadota bacterium]
MIALWQQHRQEEASSQPAVSDVAEALNIPVPEAQELLRQVRPRPAAAPAHTLSVEDRLSLEEIFLAEEERRLMDGQYDRPTFVSQAPQMGIPVEDFGQRARGSLWR